jgi:hypothetical protein
MPETVPTLTDVVPEASAAPPPSPGVARVPAQRALRTPPLPRAAPRGRALPSAAVGALAFGALALGALVIGRLVIRRLAVRRAHYGRLHIDDLEIERIHVREPHARH